MVALKIKQKLNRCKPGAGDSWYRQKTESDHELEKYYNTRVARLIDHTLDWAVTDEGSNYWSELYDELEEVKVSDILLIKHNPFRKKVGGI